MVSLQIKQDKKIHHEILTLAIPATIENLLQTLVSFIDSLIIAKISLVAVSAVGVANSILNVYLAIFLAIGVGATVLVSQSIGQEDLDKAKVKASQSLQISLVIGLLLGLVTILFQQYFLSLMQVESTVLPNASNYLVIVGGGIVFQSLSVTLGSILRATGDTITPMKVNAYINLLNVGLSMVLVFGFGMIPALGIVGAAIGSVIARMIGMLALIKKVQETALALTIKDVVSLQPMNDLLQLVIPATAERLAMRLGQVVYFSFIVMIGSNVFASHSIAGNIESFSYMPAYGLATAASVLIGRALGEQEFQKIRVIGKISCGYGVVVLGISGVILFFGAPYFAEIFTNDIVAIHNVVIALRIDAFIQPILAISLILAGALQGMGDAKTPLYSTVIGMGFVRIITVILLTHYWQLGIAGVWLSIGIDLYLRAIYLSIKFYQKTKQMTKT